MSKPYQPKTGRPCTCKRGVQRDNCPHCEGTGMQIDFAAIRERTKAFSDGGSTNAREGTQAMNTSETKDGATARPWAIHNNIGRNGEPGIVADAAPCIIACMGNSKEWPVEAKANAALIVKAVNQHAALLKVAEAAAEILVWVQEENYDCFDKPRADTVARIGLRLKGKRTQYVCALSDVYRMAALWHGQKAAAAKRAARKDGVPWKSAKQQFIAANSI